ncbi:MAG: 50S ribosomal protein L7Ae-like protein [Sulfobacillus acidophilus]|uniref:50S ribosomal protein L7Ae-like protein n=1 Tax=Sulfobacillus acidophilus TaxID=53633 RepID=A0A2T2WGQ4_9FIRM|nr:MAG: 50S ribosomal protein L7Ae-like protein [Sulfobacillus acidophilus]
MDRAALKDFRRRVVGRRETVKRIQRGAASEVYIAQDADRAIVSEIEEQCRIHQVPIHAIDTMQELGRLCGIEVSAACAALVSDREAYNSGQGGRTGANH